MTKLVKKKFKIEGMHCSSCAMSIDMDLEDIDGVKEAKTHYARAESQVEFDEEKVNVKSILKTIAQTGYAAKPLE